MSAPPARLTPPVYTSTRARPHIGNRCPQQILQGAVAARRCVAAETGFLIRSGARRRRQDDGGHAGETGVDAPPGEEQGGVTARCRAGRVCPWSTLMRGRRLLALTRLAVGGG